jgi:hypothetical protein
MPQCEGCVEHCIRVLEEAITKDPDNAEIAKMLSSAQVELKEDQHVPVPEEKARFETLFDWMKQDGSEFDKLKVRYYAPDYRGVHAAREVKKGETILYVPLKQIITLEMAMESPIGSLMAARNFRHRLVSPKHSFLATYIM